MTDVCWLNTFLNNGKAVVQCKISFVSGFSDWLIENHSLFWRNVVLVVCCFKCSLVACLCGEWINLCKDKAFLNLIMLEALKELWPHLGKYLQRPGNCDRALLILCNMSLKTLAWFTIAGPACQFIGHHCMGAPF